MAVILNVEHLRKHFGPDPVLVDVTFQVRDGDKIGLVGPNGCGKTTLLNILTGREETERGQIELVGSTTIGYLEQRPKVDASVTVLEAGRHALDALHQALKESEEIAMKIADPAISEEERERLSRRYDRLHEELMRKDAYNIEYRVERILHGVGFRDEDMSKSVASLSGGELNRLGLAKLLLEEPDIMLLDEPSNHLDLAATEWLEDFLKTTNAAVILVSHDRYFLDRVTNRTFELYAGTIDDYPGNFTKYQTLKAERLAVQTKTYEKWVEEVEKAKDFIRRNHYGMKAAQAEDRRKKLERLEADPPTLPRNVTAAPMAFPPASRTGDIVFRIEGLTKGYGERTLFKNYSFDIQRGERWAILGPIGCGKTTFLRCLLGQETPDSGEVRFGQGVEVGYFDQQLRVVDDQIAVVDAVRPTKKKVFEDLQRRKLLGAFGLSGDQQLLKVCNLSGGQRCRAALAKLAADDPNVLILDEPTNHLDLWAREALEKAINEFDGSVLFISHDRYFVDQVATKLLVVQPNATYQIIDGNYSTFRHMVSKGLIADPFLPNALDEPFVPEKTTRGPVKANSDMSRRSSLEKTSPKRKNKTTAPAPQAPVKVKGKNQGPVKGLDDPDAKNKSNGVASYKQGDPSKYAEQNFKSSQGRPAKPKQEKRKRKFPFRKVSDIEDEIFIRETRLQTLNEDILKPENLRDGVKMKALQEEIRAEEDAIKQLYEHWEEASELNW